LGVFKSEYKYYKNKGEKEEEFYLRMGKELNLEGFIMVDIKYPEEICKDEIMKVRSIKFVFFPDTFMVGQEHKNIISPFQPEQLLCIKYNGKWKFCTLFTSYIGEGVMQPLSEILSKVELKKFLR
jgi:hypothetical protein